MRKSLDTPSELLNAPETLELCCVQECDEKAFQCDLAMHWVVDRLSSSTQCHIDCEVHETN